jgi:hypothetical protein
MIDNYAISINFKDYWTAIKKGTWLMKIHHHNRENAPSSQSNKLTKTTNYNSKISTFVEQAHSLNALHLVAALCQIFLGSSVVLLSVIGLINPFWVSALMSMVGSVTAMIGLYFLYSIVTQLRDPNRLLRNAIRRVVDAQN